MRNFKFKPTSDEKATSIIMAFSSRWLDDMKKDAFSVVFRKAFPKSLPVEWIYAYLSAPVSAVAARMRVKAWTYEDLGDAVTHASKSLLSETDIREYAKGYGGLTVIAVHAIEMAEPRLNLRTLEAEFDFWPSSTYQPISSAGKEKFDEMGFSK